MHNNCHNHKTVIIPQKIIVPAQSIVVASLDTRAYASGMISASESTFHSQFVCRSTDAYFIQT